MLRKGRNNYPIGGGVSMGKIDGIRLSACSNYVHGTCLARIQVDVPLLFNYDDSELQHQIYQCWDSTHHLPEEYGEANAFIDEVRKVTEITNIALGTRSTFGNFVGLIIVKNSKVAGTIAQLEKLILKED